ncbi:MAG: 2-oxoglutarate dehydrogenase E1 component, partial [Phycisphaeraceae bacterium]
LRRQLVSRWRKPLVVMTPKSLLRHPLVVSDLKAFTKGSFNLVIGDSDTPPASAERVLLCSGKIYYDLLKQREELGREDVAIMRVEQLYPFPADSLREVLSGYHEGTPVIWVQEEPENMGAWRYMKVKAVADRLFGRFPLTGVARPESASPATGSAASHRLEQADLLERAFGEIPVHPELANQPQSC